MTEVVYQIVPHDGGWAYLYDGVYSETYPNRDAALDTARRIAAEQRQPGDTEEIEYEDENGRWKTEHVDGRDRPSIVIVE